MTMSTKRTRRLGDSGQGMVFGAISMFMLVFSAALCYNVGQVAGKRVEIQNAADAAVYSAVLVEANVVSNVAWLNDGMAFIYYNAMRYAVDTIVYGTLAEMKEHNIDTPWYVDPTDAVVGVQDAVGQYNQAYQKASTMIPRCERWLGKISRMERALALSAETLTRREAARTAAVNNVEAMAFFPWMRYYPTSGGYLLLDIERLNNGWRVTSNNGYKIEAINLGDWSWRITASDGTQIDVMKQGPGQWQIKSGDTITTLTQHSPDHMSADVNKDNTHIDCRKVPGGWAIDAHSDKSDVQYRPFKDGGYTITSNGQTTTVRHGPNGGMQEWTGSGWKDIPGQKDTVSVGGQQVPVHESNRINLPGGASLDLPGSISIGPMRFDIPNRVYVGNTSVKLGRDTCRITATVGPARFSIHEDASFSVNGLGTRDANGLWRPWMSYSDIYDWHHGGQSRHRLTEEQADREWIYEYHRADSKFLEEDMRRFGHHAICDNDPIARSRNYKYPEWAYSHLLDDDEENGWFDVASGSSRGPREYHQTRKCWNLDDLRSGERPDGADEPNGWIVNDDGDLVPCPCCNPRGLILGGANTDELDHDGDGLSDVRKYEADIIIRRLRRGQTERPFHTVNLGAFPTPLRLSDDFFKYNINVGVWRSKDTPLLGKQSPGIPGYSNPDWGYYAIASGRIGFAEKSEGGGDAAWRFNFQTPDETDWWSTKGWENLYEPVWSARIIATREAVRSIDIDANPGDTGTNYLYRGMEQTIWFDPDPPETLDWYKRPQNHVRGKIGNMRNREGGRFDPRNEDLPGAIDH